MDKSIFFILTQILPELVNKQNLYEKNRNFYNLTFIKWLKRIRRLKTKFMKSILTKDKAILHLFTTFIKLNQEIRHNLFYRQTITIINKMTLILINQAKI